MKKQMKMKTSDKWLELIEESERPMIYDADGWDRSNFQYSFYEELITKEEFNQRLMMSTCLIKTKNKNKNDK